MNTGSMIKDESRVDEDTSHEIAAAQLRGEAKAEGQSTRDMVSSVADELSGLGLEPDEKELARRYNAGDTRIPTWMREDEAS